MLRSTLAVCAACVHAAVTIGLLSDLHIGEGCVSPYNGTDDCYSVQNLRAAVAYINNVLIPHDNVSMVIISGDVTSSAELAQYAKVRALLDELAVPYYPVIGNHDTWPYSSSWEAPEPTGDVYFASTFRDILTNASDPRVAGYNTNSTWNPMNNCSSWYQNYEINVEEEGVTLFACDFNTRDHALPGYKGALPQADLANFTGGTLPWLASRLAVPRAPGTRFFMVHHQPYRCPVPIPDWAFCFSSPDKATLRTVLAAAHPVDAYWGVFAGHMHLWDNGTAFDEWPAFRQWETSACKGSAADANITSAVTSVFVSAGQVTRINYYYRDLAQGGAWSNATGV